MADQLVGSRTVLDFLKVQNFSTNLPLKLAFTVK